MALAREPVIGDNLPPTISEALSETCADLVRDLEAVAERANKAPKAIKDEQGLDIVGKIVIDVRAIDKRLDARRAVEKEPYLKGGREVDAFFAPLRQRLERISAALSKVATDYQRMVEAARRAEAEAEAKRLRDEEERRRNAERAAEEAGRLKAAEQHAAKATVAVAQANEAGAVAAAPAKELTRTVTSSGITASSATNWVFAIEDFDAIPLDKLRAYLKRDAIETAVRLAVRQGVREIAGVKIYQESKATFR